MKAKRIINVLTLVDNQYVEELYTAEAKPKRHSVRKVWLIAAIVAVAKI